MYQEATSTWNFWFSFQPHDYLNHVHLGKCLKLRALRVSTCKKDKVTLEVPAFTVPSRVWHSLCARLRSGCWGFGWDHTRSVLLEPTFQQTASIPFTSTLEGL